ncbi:MAG: glycosyltransferase family 2 protein [Bacilli bacterium]|nr:glycosyltransferase family 2 protein [Bacilli bacterium]
MQKEKISIVIPCYNEQETIPIFYKEVTKIADEMKDLDFELLFINDGSNDNTLNKIKELVKIDTRVRFISFSRNFGKEAAIYAGLEQAVGDYVTIMDADLQDPPSMLKEMYQVLKIEKYDMAGTRRVTRKGEPPIRSFFARCFYKIINKTSNIEMIDGARDYRLMTRQVVNAVLLLKEYNRYSKGLFSFVGFKTKWLEYENVKRVAGESKWSFWKLFLYAIEGIVAFTTVPLSIAAILGLVICIVSFIAIIFIIVKTIIFTDPVGGWPSLVCILLFMSGIQLLCMGIIGKYLAKTYLETKKRPIYIIKETEKDL